MASNYAISPGTITQGRYDRPARKILYRHIVPAIARVWYEVGIELMEQKDEEHLKLLRDQYGSNIKMATQEMLEFWLNRQPQASWNQLIEALKQEHIGLQYKAQEIEKMLQPEVTMSSGAVFPTVTMSSGAAVFPTVLTSSGAMFPTATMSSGAAVFPTVLTSSGAVFPTVLTSSGAVFPTMTMSSGAAVFPTVLTSSGAVFPTAIAADDDDVDFSKYEDVVVAFTSLMTRLHKKVTESQLQFIKIRLMVVTTDKEFKKSIKSKANNVNEFFELLSKYKSCCNWLNLQLVEIIAAASGNKKLEDLVNNYKSEIYSRKVRQVLEYIPQYKIKNKFYKEVKKKIPKSPDEVTVRELIRYDRPLANKIAMNIMNVVENCISITWLVPTDKVYELFLFALTIPQQSREDDFLQIGSWIVYHPQSVLQELKKIFAMASPITLLIGYYHGLLSRDVNADILIKDMYSKKLLNTDDQTLISTGYSVYKKNLLLLEHARHMDAKSFSEFCKLILNLRPEIGTQLITVTDTMKLQSDTTQDVTTEVQVVLHGQYYNPSLVYIAFLFLIDQVSKLLQCYDVKKLVEQCENIMACEEENIKLFSDDQIKKMSKCCSTLSLLRNLNYFFSWSNHSILRMLLVESLSEIYKLLDEFDSRLDPLQSIASYPIPYFSSDMIPIDTSTHTLLAITCDQELYECTLQYVYDMQSVMMEKCHITQHCLQLLAVRSDPTIFYWTIPKCVVHLIFKQAPQHSEYLYSKGMLEVLIYIKPVLTTGNDVVIGTLAFVADSKRNAREGEDVVYVKQLIEVNVQLAEELYQAKVKIEQLTEKLDQTESELSIHKQEIKCLNNKLSGIKNENVPALVPQWQNVDEIQKVPVIHENDDTYVDEDDTDVAEDEDDFILTKNTEVSISSIENENVKVGITCSQNEASDNIHPGDIHSAENLAADNTCTVTTSMSPQHTDHEQVSVNSPALRRANESQGDAGSLVVKYKHTLYHYMHSGTESDVSCPFIHDQSKEKCTEDYKEEFVSQLELLLEHNQILSGTDYIYYIHDHLKYYCKSSPSCNRLWKYLLAIKNYPTLKYAEEGLVIFSKLLGKKVGKITKQYKRLEKVIGRGGFGKVYMLYGKLAVKEEHKHPLILSNPTVFQQVTQLECKHVIPLLEYIVGRKADDSDSFQRVFLSVMPYMNRRGLDEQFKNHSCVLNYMLEYKDEAECIFNNYIVMYSHVFEGLRYLHSKKIVHGDVKDKNILVHQTCSCKSPLLCSCPFGGRVTYVLGDMGLFWIEGEKLSGKYVDWAKAKQKEPAGTAGMKAPELYFTGIHGEKCGSSKTDVWAGSATMMKVLVGFGRVNESTEEISKYLNALSHHSSKYVDNIRKAYEIAKELKMKVVEFYWNENPEEIGLVDKFNTMVQLLESDQQLKFSHWISSYTYPKKLPLPFLLSIAHGANSIHQLCLDKFPDIHSTPIWKKMKNVGWIITNGLRFLPQDRLTASQITEHLKIYT